MLGRVQVLPAVLKSAMQSTGMAVFVPSSFDFIRVHNYFRKSAALLGVSFTVLSELVFIHRIAGLSNLILNRYSTPAEISRARQSFFTQKTSFLLISERFHFYRRYAIRGIRNLIFYAPPDHAQFYTEFCSYPFLDEGVGFDAGDGDVTCRLIWGRWDRMALERIVGSEGLRDLMKVR